MQNVNCEVSTKKYQTPNLQMLTIKLVKSQTLKVKYQMSIIKHQILNINIKYKILNMNC